VIGLLLFILMIWVGFIYKQIAEGPGLYH
jgi:hypothetical protein